MALPRVVFMGSPDFVLPVLSAVENLGWDVVGVYSSPDQEAGRGRLRVGSAVKNAAVNKGLMVFTPTTWASKQTVRDFAGLKPDVVVLAAYGKLLPAEVLRIPTFGCLNVHPSLLPEYRGATPVVGALLDGRRTTGVTVFVMDEGLDTGPILTQRSVVIAPGDRAAELSIRLFKTGADLLEETLPKYLDNDLKLMPQPKSGISLTKPLNKSEGKLDWNKPAVELEREVKAYFPWPGSVTTLNGKKLQVLDASSRDLVNPGEVGEIMLVENRKIGVVTGNGLLVLNLVKMESRRAISGQEFLNGHRRLLGTKLGD